MNPKLSIVITKVIKDYTLRLNLSTLRVAIRPSEEITNQQYCEGNNNVRIFSAVLLSLGTTDGRMVRTILLWISHNKSEYRVLLINNKRDHSFLRNIIQLRTVATIHNTISIPKTSASAPIFVYTVIDSWMGADLVDRMGWQWADQECNWSGGTTRNCNGIAFISAVVWVIGCLEVRGSVERTYVWRESVVQKLRNIRFWFYILNIL